MGNSYYLMLPLHEENVKVDTWKKRQKTKQQNRKTRNMFQLKLMSSHVVWLALLSILWRYSFLKCSFHGRIPSSRWSEHMEGRGPVTLLRVYSRANVNLNLPTVKRMSLKVRVCQSGSVNSSGRGFPAPTQSISDYLEVLVFILI